MASGNVQKRAFIYHNSARHMSLYSESNLIKVLDRLMSLRPGSRGYSYSDDGTGAGGIYVNGDSPYRWGTKIIKRMAKQLFIITHADHVQTL